jgi:DNA polymerase III alpha subunit
VKIDQYGRASITEDEAFTALYQNKDFNISNCNLEDINTINQFNQALKINADRISTLKELTNLNISLQEFDQINQNNWFIPEEYRDFDIAGYLYDLCNTDMQKNRVTEELELFIQYGMLDLLTYIKYLVDTMRKERIVWGVGRGSSVASYVLYLIGIHKVDSIRYELDIHEFLK